MSLYRVRMGAQKPLKATREVYTMDIEAEDAIDASVKATNQLRSKGLLFIMLKTVEHIQPKEEPSHAQ